MSNKKNYNGMKGITLIEVIITVAILAVGLITVLQMFPLGSKITKSSQMETVAAELGQEKMEEEISISYNNISVGSITEDYGNIADFSSFKRVTSINCLRASDLSVADCSYDLINDPNPMKKIEVAVYWKNPFGGGEKSINLFNLISKR